MRRLPIFLLCILLTLSGLAWERARFLAAAAKLSQSTQRLAQALVESIERSGSLDPAQKVRSVNDFVNGRLEWTDDQTVWGMVDYWASPLETLDKGRGDCEDLAMAKYFMLLAEGVPESSLRMVYVRAQLDGRPQAHMVLAWYPTPQSEPWILDNLDPVLKKASDRPDLAPVFSFNAEGLWQGVGATTAGNPLARLSVWRDALARAREQGF
ncbi:transglutaminase-like cysteine peptidase [Inhella gelatinilytica]|uniref:Transglutaminase-like cysteine peptidase n=1 Tax=Inhella gelatinilytica TaxID=2795030 RepID=A0A931NF46_9BURK|nr:transglutaminase-like cysteine peptidase [Inhella gelatinilytica]MBH9553161.1 transglutaminase-like cysteine peptidase [Inhella gelatinilytica]